jgi:hypothetical protein
MVIVVGGVGAVLVVVMVEDTWRAAHSSFPPAPRYPILICHLITTLHTSDSSINCISIRRQIRKYHASKRDHLVLHHRRLTLSYHNLLISLGLNRPFKLCNYYSETCFISLNGA